MMQHCNNLAYQEEMRAQATELKARLLKLISDYENGAIDQGAYSKKEAEIMARLSELTKKIAEASQVTESSQNVFNTGLGL